MENYEVLKQVGKGSFGVVQQIKRKEDGKIMVWKEVNFSKMNERERQQLIAEVKIMKELNHPNIVRYYDRIIDKKQSKIYIIMEYCESGDLGSKLQHLKKEKGFVKEEIIWKIFAQLLIALNECHNRPEGKILHRDLKPANLFIDSNDNIKLGDFGLSRFMTEESAFATTHVGTPYYMSPEQIKESKYNEKSDIWSAGCLLYQLAALRPPFEAQNHLALAIKIEVGKFERLPIRYSQDLQYVIEYMLKLNPNDRPSVGELLKLPQISLYLRERKLVDFHTSVKQKEGELKKKEESIIKKKGEIQSVVADLSEKEKILKQLEEQVSKLEEQNNERESNYATECKNNHGKDFALFNRGNESSSSASKNSTFASSNGTFEILRKENNNKESIINNLFGCNKREIERQRHLQMFEALKKRFEESSTKQMQSPAQENQIKQEGKDFDIVRKSLHFIQRKQEQIAQTPIIPFEQLNSKVQENKQIINSSNQVGNSLLHQNYIEEFKKQISARQNKSVENINSCQRTTLHTEFDNYSSSKKDEETSTAYSTVAKNPPLSQRTLGSDQQQKNSPYLFQHNASQDGYNNQISSRSELPQNEKRKLTYFPQNPINGENKSAIDNQSFQIFQNIIQQSNQIRKRERVNSEERYNGNVNVPSTTNITPPLLNLANIQTEKTRQRSKLSIDATFANNNNSNQPSYFLPYPKEVAPNSSRQQMNYTSDCLNLLPLQNQPMQKGGSKMNTSQELYKASIMKRSDSQVEQEFKCAIPSKKENPIDRSILLPSNEGLKNLLQQQAYPTSKVNCQPQQYYQAPQGNMSGIQKPPLKNNNQSIQINNITNGNIQQTQTIRARSNKSLTSGSSTLQSYLKTGTNSNQTNYQQYEIQQERKVQYPLPPSSIAENQNSNADKLNLIQLKAIQNHSRTRSINENQMTPNQNLKFFIKQTQMKQEQTQQMNLTPRVYQ